MYINIIIIKGGAYNDIKKALQQWMQLYEKDLLSDITLELYKNGRGHHIIKADKRIDNERFYYLVNYLYYPEGINYTIDIEGFTRAVNPEIIRNKNLLVYIPDTDKDGDNVFAVTEYNDTFKIDFGGKVKPADGNRQYHVPEIGELSNPEIIRFNKIRTVTNIETDSLDNPGKRFRIISLILLGAIILSSFMLLKSEATYFKTTLIIGIGINVWFFADYTMLQVEKYYWYCFCIAIAYFGYGYLIKQNSIAEINLDNLGFYFPLNFIIIQKPLRYVFIKIFKREPVVEKPVPSFADFIYVMLLLFGGVFFLYFLGRN